jgi:hypothetical protein
MAQRKAAAAAAAAAEWQEASAHQVVVQFVYPWQPKVTCLTASMTDGNRKYLSWLTHLTVMHYTAKQTQAPHALCYAVCRTYPSHDDDVQ